MNQQDFEQRHAAIWQQLDQMILDMERKRKSTHADQYVNFPHLYRQVCHHLAIARERQYTTHLIDRLNQLMLRSHQFLYSARAGNIASIMQFIGGGFPALIRREKRLFWLSFALFALPGIIMGLAVYFWPIFSIVMHNNYKAHIKK